MVAVLLGIEDSNRAYRSDRLFGIDENPEAVDELIRKLNTQFLPAIDGLRAFRLRAGLRDGSRGVLVAIQVPQSDKVHSILDDGTWKRGESSNREMNATEVTELSYQRGVRSAESEPVDIAFDCSIRTWKLFRAAVALHLRIADQSTDCLAKKVATTAPLRASVLLNC